MTDLPRNMNLKAFDPHRKGFFCKHEANAVPVIRVLHESVKFGSAESAGYLFGAFDDGESLVASIKDEARSRWYRAIADALRRNTGLRLLNLDKVLPLPLAPLPQWNGNKQTPIDAAKAVVPGRETV